MLMPRAGMVLIVLFVALAASEPWGEQERGPDPPVVTSDTPKQCCRVCKKGKPCGNGCISQERQCTKASGCACNGSGTS
jgi:hypothetical protein